MLVRQPIRALTIAGSDSGGSAGLQADLKTFEAHRVFGMSVVTLVTAQNTCGVQAALPIPLAMVQKQLDALMGDMGADAVKTGFLGRAEVVNLVAATAQNWQQPLVVDPVLVNGQGERITDDETLYAYQHHLFPYATLITPNLDEVALLAGMPSIKTLDELRSAAQTIYASVLSLRPENQHHPFSIVLKGGQLGMDSATIVDLLFDGQQFHEFRTERLAVENPHGVGCTLSAAIAANLAHGQPMIEAVGIAFTYLWQALAGSLNWQLGKGRVPVKHHIPWQL